jgi:23S rRNA (uracil1939-C5)-methyltransferase
MEKNITLEKNIPVEKNKDYEIDIAGMGYEGEGVGKIEDFTIFVQGALLGETVKIRIVKTSKSFAFGKLLEIIKPSPDRTEPACEIYKRCGGCQLQHLSYEGQLKYKTQRVVDAITRIGKLSDVKVNETIGMDIPYRYRNKVQLPIGIENAVVKIGFYAQRTHEIIGMDNCIIQDEIADKVVKLTKEWIQKYNISTYNELNHSGVLRHIMIRRGFKTGEVMVVLVTKVRELPYSKEFVDTMLKNIDGIKSIVQNINDKKTNVILGEKCKTLWGEENISDYIGEFNFKISPLSFFQVNPVQTEVLYNKTLEYAGLEGPETVFDAYCGTGTISLFLSKKCKKVYGVEIVPQAIENAIENAKTNKIKNAEFIVGESEKIIPELISKGIKAEVVVVDPPRKGCEKALLEAIAQMAPEKIVYVSCDVSTLARDLAILQDLGYKAVEIQPVDMFPQTAHVECVVLIERM